MTEPLSLPTGAVLEVAPPSVPTLLVPISLPVGTVLEVAPPAVPVALTEPVSLPSGSVWEIAPPAIPALLVAAPAPPLLEEQPAITIPVLPVPGIRGPQGLQGLTGEQGIQGEQGVQGIQGIQGLVGPSGANAPVFNETPFGTQDGTNMVFTLANSYQSGSTQVYRNGLREILGHGYLESAPDEITFTTAPLGDDVLVVDYFIT